MSEDGPHSTTRSVLNGHKQFMKRDGSGCWAGVRRLAIVTGLNKTTVARHRALAIRAGWLIVSARSPRSRFRVYLAAIPDGLTARNSGKARRSANIAALSELTGRLARRRLSASSRSSVQLGRTHCPLPPDKTLPLTKNRTLAPADLRQATADAQPFSSGVRDERTENASNRLRLLHWLRTDGMAERYCGCHDFLIKMTPRELQFPGYEAVIRGSDTRGRDG
jgi:hypothetical protein